MIYEKATAEVILFDNSDVIRTSGCCKGNKGSSNHDNGGGNDDDGKGPGWNKSGSRPDRSRSHRNF